MEIFRLLIGTVELRPYVFIFFAIYLFIAISNIGWKRTAVFTILAYLIAFGCEYSSSHTELGIPFGVYRYLQSTRGQEIWIAGVPFMDSLSFTFLSYISYELARFLLSRSGIGDAGIKRNISSEMSGDIGVASVEGVRHSVRTAALAAFLMMYLDIIIDPVALQGKRWFLGEIYDYPNGGSYFGVTLANFAGWFVVCFVILIVFFRMEKLLFAGAGRVEPGPANSDQPKRFAGSFDYPLKRFAPAGLYFGIMGFNLWVTFHIGEVIMGLAGVFICLPLLLMVVLAALNAERVAS